MSQAKFRFIESLPVFTLQNVSVQAGDTLLNAIGKLQGEINSLGAFLYSTYALAFAALNAGTMGDGSIVRVTADETQGGAGSWYVVNADQQGKIFDIDFITTVGGTYLFQALTLLAVDVTSSGSVTPTYVDPSSTTYIPANSQLLYTEEITIDGEIVIDGILSEVN